MNEQAGIADVLRRTRETLRTAQLGLDDLHSHDARRKVPGLCNLVVFGRAVTNVLQNIRTYDRAHFDAWYLPIQQAMRQDPLLKYFYVVRSEILKEGQTRVAGKSAYLEHLNLADLQSIPRPPNAEDFFMGDALGGSGWMLRLPDGSEEPYYVRLPDSIQFTTKLHFANPPGEHLGEQLADTSIEALAALYIRYLIDLVDKADKEFRSS